MKCKKYPHQNKNENERKKGIIKNLSFSIVFLISITSGCFIDSDGICGVIASVVFVLGFMLTALIYASICIDKERREFNKRIEEMRARNEEDTINSNIDIRIG